MSHDITPIIDIPSDVSRLDPYGEHDPTQVTEYLIDEVYGRVPKPQEIFLAQAPVMSIEDITKSVSSGSLWLVNLGDSHGYFKPSSGEVESCGVPAGTGYGREVASYVVSDYFDFNLVPSTIVRDINGQIGSLQAEVPDLIEGDKLKQKYYRDSSVTPEEKYKMWFFDLITAQRDRLDSNWGVHKTGSQQELCLFDNGMSFQDQLALENITCQSPPEPFTFFDQEAPAFIQDICRRYQEDRPTHQQRLRLALSGLINDTEISSFFGRLDKFSQQVISSTKISIDPPVFEN